MKIFVIFLSLFAYLISLITYHSPSSVYARVTPEDRVNAQKADYNSKVKSYSKESQQKLETVSGAIETLNQQKTTELARLMELQGQILDEYKRRNGDIETAEIEKARYWITYAHEAVAYQAAKIYIFNLTSEANLTNDIQQTVSLFEGELRSTRTKVINSYKTLKGILQ